MGIQFQFSDNIQSIKNHPKTEIYQTHLNYFLETIESKDHGFFRINNDAGLIEQSEAGYKKFKSKGKIVLKTDNKLIFDNLHHCSDIKSIWSCLKAKRRYKKS